jgi:hypothetical protein
MFNAFFFRLILLVSFTSFIFNSASAQKKSQEIRGVISDKSTNELLVGVYVYVMDSSKQIIATTDVNGLFVLENVPLGRARIQCSYLGYETYISSSFMVNSAKQEYFEIKMEQSPYALNEVVVSAVIRDDRTQNNMVLLGGRSFSAEETERYAGSIADPSRMAVSFAGVQSSNDINNDIVIRGNSSVGVLWRLEGIDIPNPNHFSRRGSSGGGISVFSVNMLRNSDFIYGAPPAEYGNALAGVFDMKFRKGNRNENEYSFRAGILGLEATLEGPIKKGKSSYLVNYRYSTLGILNEMGVHLVNANTDNTFTDLSFHVYLPSEDNKNIFQIWGIGGSSSEFHRPIPDFDEIEEYDNIVETDFKTSMGVVGMSYTRLMDNEKYLKYNIAFMGDDITHNRDTFDLERTPNYLSDESYKTNRITNTLEYGQNLSKSIILKSGLTLSLLGNDLKYSEYDRVDKAFYDHIDYNSSFGDLRLFQSYIQTLWNATSRLSFTAGLNFMRFNLNGSSSLNYSAAGAYQFDNGNDLSVSFGKYAQMLPIGTYFTNPQNRDLDLMNSLKANVAYGWQLRNDFKISIEAYYEKLSNIPVSSDVAINYWMLNDLVGFSTEELESEGLGRNYGVELTMERFFNKGFFMLLSGSIYNSEYSLGDDQYYNTRYNGKFNSSLMLGKEFTLNNDNVISLSFRNLVFGGQWYRPANTSITKSIREYYDDEFSFESIQNKTYWRSDFRFSFRKNNKKNSWIIALDIQNLFNITNTRDEIWNIAMQDYQFRNQVGLIPIISFQVDF